MPQAWRLIWNLARKDWLLFFADRRAALLCFTVPIILASLFGLIFDRPSDSMAGTMRLKLLVVDEDKTDTTRRMIHDLNSGRAEVQVVDRATAESLMESRHYGVSLVLPHGFTSREAFSRPRVEMLYHPLSAMESQWAEGIVTEIVMKFKAREFLEPLGVEVSRIDKPLVVERHAAAFAGQQRFNSYSHSFSGMTLQYLLFWGMESGLLLLRERQSGVWRRLRSAPVPLWALLAGRAFATGTIALLQVLTTFSFGYVAFGVTITGSWLGFLLLAFAISVLASATGLLVAAIGGTEARARSVCILAILAVSMLGGLWLPTFLLPNWVQELSLSLPTTWAMRGLDGLTWQGQSLGVVWPCVLAVAGFAMLFLVLAVSRFAWSEARRKRGWAT